MQGDLNRITIIGRLTRDPELKYIQSGTAICNCNIACNRTYITNNEKKTEVSYLDIIIWGKLGETLAEYMKKGSRIAIEGRLQQRRWEDQDGNKRSKIEIVADGVQFLDGKSDKPTSPAPDDNPFTGDDIPF